MRKSFKKGQSLAEIAVFGAIFIFLIGVIVRTHISTTQNQNHQVRAMKLALLESYQSSQGTGNRTPNSSRNSSSVIFVEDRLSPDFNKYNTIDRSPFMANGSGTMSNRLFYTVDFVTYKTAKLGEVGDNLPILDVFINGQHFPLTVGAYVLRVLYNSSDTCPDDWVGTSASRQHGAEYIRCRRQQAERGGGDCTTNSNCSAGNTCNTTTHKCSGDNPMFYSLAVNGTQVFDPASGTFDLLRNNWDREKITGQQSVCLDDVPGCPGTSFCHPPGANGICKTMAWQWRPIAATGSNVNASPSNTTTNIGFGGNGDSRTYPQVDTSGSLREQSLYAVTLKDHAQLMTILNKPAMAPYIINWNKDDQGKNHVLSLTPSLLHNVTAGTDTDGETDFNLVFNQPEESLGITRKPGSGVITGVVVLDTQLGDIDNSFDKRATPGPVPGLMQPSEIYTQVNPGTFLQIKEGKLYNPETHAVVRSISSKEHVDLITRYIQLSNNTGRFCTPDSNGHYSAPETLADQHDGEKNPVKACAQSPGECTRGSNFTKTCYDPFQRIIYVRTMVGEKVTRKWFTDVTKGL